MNEPMTVEAFNRQLGMGSYTFTGAPVGIKVENGLNRTCPIHLVPMQNIQHPTKPLGVIVAQICPECQKQFEAARQSK